MTEEIFDAEFTEDEKKLLEDILSEDKEEFTEHGIQRRNFLKQLLAGSGGVLALQLISEESLLAETITADGDLPVGENMLKVNLKINGLARSVQVDSRMTL
ncbi:MAG: hypothetical protein ABIN94_18580, partial [Ferruginibacter sp.]